MGAVDLAALFVPPTAYWPQLAGGALFGIGFVAGGWCPGTAAVGVARGKGDALVFLVGAGVGSLAFAALEPRLRGFLHGGELPACSLPELIGLGALPGAVVLLLIAVAASLAATRVERLVARRNP